MKGMNPMLFSRDQLRRLLIPLLLEQLFTVLIGMADTVMVANCGEAAVSGISLVDSVNVLLISVFSALATGGAVLSSQYIGRGDHANASLAAKMLFYVVLMFSTGIMAVCLFLRTPLLQLLYGSVEQSVMDNCRIYFFLSALSYPFMAFYNASCALLRARGNSQATLRTSIYMNIINVVLNAVTIFLLQWGVFGAGFATLIARAAGAVISFRALNSPESQQSAPRLHQLEWDGGLVRRIMMVGVPNGFENGLFQLGKLLLVGMIATFGTASITANAVGNTLGTFHVLPGNAIGLAMITVVGQCCGAHEYDQARYYTRKLMQLSYLCMGTLNIVLLLLTPVITIPFNLTEETAALAKQVIFIHGAGCVVLWPMSFTMPNALRAAGDARFTMLVSIFSMAAFRIAFGYLLGSVVGLGVIGVWLAMQIDWVFRIICFVLRWRSGVWQAKTLV